MNIEKINHEEHAIEALRSIPRDVPPALAAQVAQAAATLALVEQQRIANLIALGQYRIMPTELPRHRTVLYTPPPDDPESDWPLRDDIREALRL